MARTFNRRYRNRASGFKRRSYKSRGTPTRKIAKRALRYVKQLAPEVKHAPVAISSQQTNNSPLASYVSEPLTAIAQGATDVERIAIKSLLYVIQHI